MSARTMKGPRPSDAVLLLLAEVSACIEGGHDDGLGAPEAGHRSRTVGAAVKRGFLERRLAGGLDVEQGPRRLVLTEAGRAALDLWGVDHRRYVAARTGVSG